MIRAFSHRAKIVLLSHADTDLITAFRAWQYLPDDFPPISGISLQSLHDDERMHRFLNDELPHARIIIMRVLGKPNSIPHLLEIAKKVKDSEQNLIVISGTGEPNADLACIANVPPAYLHETLAYFHSGGSVNIGNLFRFVSDHFLMTAFGYEAPRGLPEHGIYHPELPDNPSLDDWLGICAKNRPTVGINFYRAHWLSGNTQFIDALVSKLEDNGLNAMPVFTSSLRSIDDATGLPHAFKYFRSGGTAHIQALINTTSFSAADINSGGITIAGPSIDALTILNVPVIQAICSNMTAEQWQTSSRGLNPLDTAMNVVMPEFDGRIVSVPICFKEKTHSAKEDVTYYQYLEDRVTRVAGLALNLIRLSQLSNEQKRIAFVLTNSNTKASQIGNAVGLDAPASLLSVLQEMRAAGYKVDDLPDSGNALIHDLIDRCSYDQLYLSGQQCQQAVGRVAASVYNTWFGELPQDMQDKMIEQWGEPPGKAYIHGNQLIIAGLEYGNVVVVLQPPRGYGMDPNAIYHQPDLPPTHHYYALYKWLRSQWRADAIVHVGKHGTLEWLPGKGVGLSSHCFPDAFLSDMPLVYPFIINDPGEGSQAKRRGHAVIIDHLTPPMTRADTYGLLAQLVQLVDEYYQVELLDPAKLPLLQQQIWELVKKAHLDQDLSHVLKHELFEHEHIDHGGVAPVSNPSHESNSDRQHEDDHEHSEHYRCDNHMLKAQLSSDTVPDELSKMNSVKISHLIQEIDGYLCELGAATIRDGLHVLGSTPEGEQLTDMLCALTRLPNIDVPGLQSELANCFGYSSEALLDGRGKRLAQPSPALEQAAKRNLVTCADALEALDVIAQNLFSQLAEFDFQAASIDQVLQTTLGTEQFSGYPKMQHILAFACHELVPRLRRTGDEIANLLLALEGKYVPPGPSGSPTRGMAHVLPTGRNFYSVDPQALPSQSAWHVGQQLANEVIRRHQKETGAFPESVSISVWGTSAMRTHGDDIAEILALYGVRPLWHPESRRVSGVEAIPLSELSRPRIDVTVRISGFFRDAFPHLINLVDQAVSLVAALDEPPEQNFVRKHYLADLNKCVSQGMDGREADQKSRYRIFGSKPGSYGAGILPLINEGNWQNGHDFAETYVNWGGYAYGQNDSGTDARDEFRHRLSTVEVAVHNQDNREHDIFDSDDYFQFHGGMIATIASLTGKKPRHYFGDSHNPGRAVVRDLKEETLRVFRSRVINPKWLASIQRHGYKGGLELAATVDYLFGYDATADVLQDWMYEEIAQSYALDEAMREWLAESNPWALNAISERLLEAVARKMWSQPKPETIDNLKQVYLMSETQLEKRGESSRNMERIGI